MRLVATLTQEKRYLVYVEFYYKSKWNIKFSCIYLFQDT